MSLAELITPFTAPLPLMSTMTLSPRACLVRSPQSRRRRHRLDSSTSTSTSSYSSITSNGEQSPTTSINLNHIALQVSAIKEASRVRYVIIVQHTKTKATWSCQRSFDELLQFQQRVLRALDHGHFCDADCPWFYSFLKSYFPKQPWFGPLRSVRVMTERRDGLANVLGAMQQFVLDKTNHGCSIVDEVAQELLSLIKPDPLFVVAD